MKWMVDDARRHAQVVVVLLRHVLGELMEQRRVNERLALAQIVAVVVVRFLFVVRVMPGCACPGAG